MAQYESVRLDETEQAIIESFENDEWRAVPEAAANITKLRAYATDTLRHGGNPRQMTSA